MARAKLARFYGWTDEVISSMEARRVHPYLKAIERIEAQEALLGMNISDYPKMKNSDRSKLYKSIRSRAFPVSEQLPITSEDMERMIKNGR